MGQSDHQSFLLICDPIPSHPSVAAPSDIPISFAEVQARQQGLRFEAVSYQDHAAFATDGRAAKSSTSEKPGEVQDSWEWDPPCVGGGKVFHKSFIFKLTP